MNFLSSEIPELSAEALASVTESTQAMLRYHNDDSEVPPSKYPQLLFLRYISDRDDYLKDNAAAMRILARAIGFHNTPNDLQKVLYALYRNHFCGLNRDAVLKFKSMAKEGHLLVLHMSCLPRINLAFESAQSFVGPQISNITIVGDSTKKNYELDGEREILYVPAPDVYEGLAVKAAAAYKFLSFAGLRGPVLKVDDDVRCLSPQTLVKFALPLIQRHDYLGRVWKASAAGFSRWWHVGKCRDRTLNEEPYSLIADALYAEGPAYGLSCRAVQILGKAGVYLKGQFASENGYEDLAVGKVLNFYGIYPFRFDLIRQGILTSSDPQTRARLGSWRSMKI